MIEQREFVKLQTKIKFHLLELVDFSGKNNQIFYCFCTMVQRGNSGFIYCIGIVSQLSDPQDRFFFRKFEI